MTELNDVRVLVLHNHYRERGGEDVAFEQEIRLLRDHGHQTEVLERGNTDVDTSTLATSVRLFGETVWSGPSYRATREAIRRFRPDVVHIHNVLPLLSPSVYYAAWAERLPIVQSLHNYRLICPGTLLRRDGRLCEDCVGRSTWRGALHACYRGSHSASLAVVAMLQAHRALGTWQRAEAFIAVSEFQRQKLVAGGLPAASMHVKPNCVTWEFPVRSGPGEYALYVGRLSPEKGIQTLVEGWSRAGEAGTGLPLKVVGAGPLEEALRRRASGSGAQIEFVGHQSRSEVARLLLNARYLVYPSELYEPLGISVLEAFAAGVPVLASRIGALADLVEDQRTGAHFAAGDPEDLVRAGRHLACDLDRNMTMGAAARRTYMAHYTPEQNYQQLLAIYGAAQARRRQRLALGSAAAGS